MKVVLGIIGYLIVASILGPIFLFDMPGIGPYLFAGLVFAPLGSFLFWFFFIRTPTGNVGLLYSKADIDRARHRGFQEGRRSARW